MRLFKHPSSGYYYLETARGRARTLKTKNKLLATELYKLALTDRSFAVIGQRPPQRRTLADFSAEYELSRKGTAAMNTLRIDAESFAKLTAFLPAGTLLPEITQKQMEDFRAHLVNVRGLSPVTVNICLRSLRAAFNKAVQWQYLPASPMARVKEIRIKDDAPRALTAEEVQRLLDNIDNPEFLRFVSACLYTGGRREAVAKLQWEDIKQHGKDWIVTMRHTKGSVLTIPLAGRLKAILWPHRKAGPVFPYYHRQFREASRHFRRAADKAGLSGVKLHDLRHTCGTFMVMKGVPLRIVQRILGHSTVRMTERYTKIAEQYLKGATDVLEF